MARSIRARPWLQIIAEPLHLDPTAPRGPARRARVADVLTQVGLSPGDADRLPHQFSGGQRQRIAIARALISGPRLVVADEPVSALDLFVQAQVLNLLMDLRDRQGLAFLFISHNLAVVQILADRIAVMYRGRFVETGPTDEIFRRPMHPYTRLLLEAEPRIEAPEAAREPLCRSDPRGRRGRLERRLRLRSPLSSCHRGMHDPQPRDDRCCQQPQCHLPLCRSDLAQ